MTERAVRRVRDWTVVSAVFAVITGALIGFGSGAGIVLGALVLGTSHAVPLALALHATGHRMGIAVYVLLSCLFPIWGSLIGFFGMGIISAMLCSAVWAFALLFTGSDRLSAVMIKSGVAANTLGLLIGFIASLPTTSPAQGLFHESAMPGIVAWQVVVWHVSLIWFMPKAVRRGAEAYAATIAAKQECITCGYSLAGLREPICPECGSAVPTRPASSSTHAAAAT